MRRFAVRSDLNASAAAARWGLFAERDFRLLFAASVLATLGASVAQLALPLTAVKLLHAGPVQMGLLGAVELLPFALFGLPAGSWIDRARKRRLAMGFDLLGTAALALVPLAYMAGLLSLPVLYVAGFLVGCSYAIGGSAMQVFVAQLVGRERLVEANSRIVAAESFSSVVGPALAAGLIGAVGAPLAVTATALGFLLSFVLLSRIDRDDVPEARPAAGWWHEARDGLRFIRGNAILAGMALAAAGWVLLFEGFRALYVLYSTHDLGMTARDIAIANAVGACGAILGARAARGVERRAGPRAGIAGGFLLAAIGTGLFAAASGAAHVFGIAALIGAASGLFLLDFGATLYVVNYLSLRQRITPDALLGRMTSTMRFLSVAPAPLGSLLAGTGAEHLGVATMLLVIAAGVVALALTAAAHLPTMPAGIGSTGIAAA